VKSLLPPPPAWPSPDSRGPSPQAFSREGGSPPAKLVSNEV
jgi:hypothetical protein